MFLFSFIDLQQHTYLPKRGFGGSEAGALGGAASMASKGCDATGKSIHAMEAGALGGAAPRNTTVAEENKGQFGEYSVSVNHKVMVNITPDCDERCQKVNRIRDTRKHMLNDNCTICWKYVVGKADTEWPKGMSKKGEKYTLWKMAKRTQTELPELWKVQVKIHS